MQVWSHDRGGGCWNLGFVRAFNDKELNLVMV